MRRLLLTAALILPALVLTLGADASAGQVDAIKGEGGQPFVADLNPANEVPPAPGSDLTGRALVTINKGQSEICWDLDYMTSQMVIAAHIHHGAPGTAGPIVFGFFNPPPATAPVNEGCRSADPALIDAIRADPGDFYVNVHTTAHPTGAGRGPLTRPGRSTGTPGSL